MERAYGEVSAQGRTLDHMKAIRLAKTEKMLNRPVSERILLEILQRCMGKTDTSQLCQQC